MARIKSTPTQVSLDDGEKQAIIDKAGEVDSDDDEDMSGNNNGYDYGSAEGDQPQEEQLEGDELALPSPPPQAAKAQQQRGKSTAENGRLEQAPQAIDYSRVATNDQKFWLVSAWGDSSCARSSAGESQTMS